MAFTKVKLDKMEKLTRRSKPEALSHGGWRVEEEPGNTHKAKNNKLEKFVASKEEGKHRACAILEAN